MLIMQGLKVSKKIVLVANNIKSRGLKALANKLSERVGYRVYRVGATRIRNRIPICFLHGIDKRQQMELFSTRNVSAPGYSFSRDGCLSFECSRIVARALTNSSEGRGITIFNKGDTPPPAPLYTEYIPKKKEFRVHVWNNEVIDVSEKRKKSGYEAERNTQIRNTANGYVFCRTNVVEPDGLRQLALDAVAALGRTYGAVDIIWNEKRDKCYVLEVNSRPGMEGTTVEIYANAILKGLQ
jgi:hypothetical protein